MGEEYNYIMCGIKKKHMKTYYNTVLNKGKPALLLYTFKNRDSIQNLVVSMYDDWCLSEWELHTLEDPKWNDNRQRLDKYCT
jgi:hypothetical protein